jgi:hypothetical protein
MSRYPSEADDQKLAEDLLFSPHGLTLLKVPQGAGRTPDFQVIQNGVPVAYFELKSPRGEWLDNKLDDAKPGEIVCGCRNDPTFNRIGRHAQNAAEQFRAVNETRALPNILVFLNHDDASGFGDLMETFTGLFHSADGSRYETMAHVASRLKNAKEQIDLCVWINGRTSRVQGILFNRDATPNYLNQLCVLLGKNSADIKY